MSQPKSTTLAYGAPMVEKVTWPFSANQNA